MLTLYKVRTVKGMFLCFRSGVYSSSATLAGSGKLNTTQPAGPTSNVDGSAAFVRRFIGCRTLEKGQALSYTKREREKSRKFWDADRRFDPTAPLLRVVVSVYFILFYCFSLCDSFFFLLFFFFFRKLRNSGRKVLLLFRPSRADSCLSLSCCACRTFIPLFGEEFPGFWIERLSSGTGHLVVPAGGGEKWGAGECRKKETI